MPFERLDHRGGQDAFQDADSPILAELDGEGSRLVAQMQVDLAILGLCPSAVAPVVALESIIGPRHVRCEQAIAQYAQQFDLVFHQPGEDLAFNQAGLGDDPLINLAIGLPHKAHTQSEAGLISIIAMAQPSRGIESLNLLFNPVPETALLHSIGQISEKA